MKKVEWFLKRAEETKKDLIREKSDEDETCIFISWIVRKI